MRALHPSILPSFGLALALGPFTACTGAPSQPASAATGADGPVASSRRLFSTATGPDTGFQASDLVRRYRKNLLPFLRPDLALPRTDLEVLDTHARTAKAEALSDSAAIRLYEAPRMKDLTELAEQEKDDLVPPKPGAYAAIPSPVAATGALLGGIGLLVKLIADLAR